MFYKNIFTVFITLLLASCVTSNYSGFLPNQNGLEPFGGGEYSDQKRELRITSPEKRVIFVWNHGTKRPHQLSNCQREYNKIPLLIKETAQKFDAEIYFLCSVALDNGNKGSYTYKRANEIESLLDQFIEAGVKPDNIFLLGHSAGGWASLLSNRFLGQKFAGTIAFAPAFAGPRHEENKYPIWRQTLRPQQVKYLEELPMIDALVFAYSDDKFNRPVELAFLKKFNSVRLIEVNDCHDGHQTTFGYCLKEKARPLLEQYINEKLKK